MKTHWGVNPSFCNWTSRLPLFADPIRRGISFEVFREDGTPTGELSPLGPDGWPVVDGRWHGVRLFGDMDGFMPELHPWSGADFKLRVGAGSAFLCWKGRTMELPVSRIKPMIGEWHLPSLEALRYFKPKMLRTLDWGWQGRKEKRPDWTKARVSPDDPLQGAEMALEFQCDAANKLDCCLWWNAPPRFELSVEMYEEELTDRLIVIKSCAKNPVIIEYGNELWNSGFPVHNWLEPHNAEEELWPWHIRAADEINILRRVCERVFGNEQMPLRQKPYYFFVGGCLADGGWSMDKILSGLDFRPDICGPAFYVTPPKATKERWGTDGYIPSQELLMDALFLNLPALQIKLEAHRSIQKKHNVPLLGVYEAGQSLIARGKPWKKTALEVQRSERMGDLYREIRKTLDSVGVDLACLYSACTDQTPGDARVDVFGLLEATLDKATPMPKAVAARGE